MSATVTLILCSPFLLLALYIFCAGLATHARRRIASVPQVIRTEWEVDDRDATWESDLSESRRAS